MMRPDQYEVKIKKLENKIEHLQSKLAKNKFRSKTKGPKWYLKEADEMSKSHKLLLKALACSPTVGFTKPELVNITTIEGTTSRLNEMVTHLGFVSTNNKIKREGKTFTLYKITDAGLEYLKQEESE